MMIPKDVTGKRAVRNFKKFLHSVLQLLVAANVPSSPILVTLMMEGKLSSEALILTRATQR
jgi:hypothetical protein